MSDEHHGADASGGSWHLRLSDVPKRDQRRLIAVTAARSTLYVVGLLVAYALVPAHERWGASAVVQSILAGGLTLAVIGYQVVAVNRAAFPALRAVESGALAAPLLLVVGACVNLALSADDASAFTEQLDHVDALYFSLTTVTTIGYGDISPVTNAARIVVMIQMVVNVFVIGAGVRLIINTAKNRLDDHSRSGEARGRGRSSNS